MNTNIISCFFEEDFVRQFLTDNLLRHYPGFDRLGEIKIKPIKKHVWETTYHVVIRFEVELLNDRQRIKLPIFCSANSDEDRVGFFNNLQLLWRHGFNQGNLIAPRPLFYSAEFKAIFYRGLDGVNVFTLIKRGDLERTEEVIERVGWWLAKLHALPLEQAKKVLHQSGLEKVVPGYEFVSAELYKRFPQQAPKVLKIYDQLIEEEKELNKNCVQVVTHGDIHPENVIVGQSKISAIDFVDMCLASRARDLGSFLQQLDYMITKRAHVDGLADKVKAKFLKAYLQASGVKLDDNLQQGIDCYYRFSALRIAIYHFLMHHSEPEKGIKIIEETFNN